MWLYWLALTLVVLYFYSKQRVYIGCLVCALALEISRLGSNPMADTITMNYTSEHNGNYGSIRAMGSLGYMLISMLVGFLADIFGLDGPMFTTYMVLVGIAILLCLTFPKTTSKETEEVIEEIQAIKEEAASILSRIFLVTDCFNSSISIARWSNSGINTSNLCFK